MRTGAFVVGALVVLASVLTYASAQPANAGLDVLLLEDPTGDVQAETPAGPVQPLADLSHVDLTSLRLVEDSGQVHLSLTTGGGSTGDVQPPQVDLGFVHHDTEFLLQMRLFPPAAPDASARTYMLHRQLGGAEWDEIGNVRTEISDGGQRIDFSLERQRLADQDHAEPYPGRTLHSFWVEVQDHTTNAAIVGGAPTVGTITRLVDKMPDDGVAGEYTFILGEKQEGSASLGSERPVRSSNGEETTFVFHMLLTNTGTAQTTYTVSIEEAPPSWNVAAPIDVVEVRPTQEVSLPIVAASPFQHDHGGKDSILVKVTNAEDGTDVSRKAFTVQYLDIPQPSGHHPRLWLHSRGAAGSPMPEVDPLSSATAVMNALEEDPNSTMHPVKPTGYSVIDDSDRYTWCVRLTPGLSLGLAFDADVAGAWSGSLRSGLPLEGTLGGELLVAHGDMDPGALDCLAGREAVHVATLSPTDVSVAPGDPVSVETAVVANGDVVPHTDGADLWLLLHLDTDRPLRADSVDGPLLLPGGVLDLPLEEYHDPVAVDEGANALFQLVGEARLLRNAGTIAAIEIDVVGTQELMFELLGTRPEWASIQRAADGATFVVVEVPDDAPDGAIADLVVRGEANDGRVELARVVIEVDDEQTHGDDRTLVETFGPTVDAPFPADTALLVALAYAVRRAHRL